MSGAERVGRVLGRLTALVLWRLKRASRRPGAADWLVTAAVALVYLLLAVPLASATGLVAIETPLALPAVASLALRVLFIPALAEELLFRVLPNPHPHEEAGRAMVWSAAGLSLGAYLLAHPLAGLLSPHPTPFAEPAFLLLAGSLGAACLLLYRRTGSLWSPLVLHWLVVTGWLSLGGRGILAPV